MSQIYGKNVVGKVVEIQNWNNLASDGVRVTRELAEAEVDTYQTLKQQGQTDNQIWWRLHPDRVGVDRASDTVAVVNVEKPVDFLTKQQLITLIQEHKQVELSSMMQMNKGDIIKLFKILFSATTVRVQVKKNQSRSIKLATAN